MFTVNDNTMSNHQFRSLIEIYFFRVKAQATKNRVRILTLYFVLKTNSNYKSYQKRSLTHSESKYSHGRNTWFPQGKKNISHIQYLKNRK